MCRSVRRTVVALFVVAVAAGGTPALAKDLCITLPVTGTVVYAFKSFVAPGHNRCKSLAGFSTIHGWELSGAACTTADGKNLRLSFAAHPLVGGTTLFDVGCNLPLPSMAGGDCRGTNFSPGVNPDVSAFTAIPSVEFCTATVP